MDGAMNIFFKGIMHALGFVLVLLFFTIFVVAFSIYILNPQNSFSEKYIICPSIQEQVKTPKKAVTIEQLLAEGKIIPASEISNGIIGYYNSLITILVTLLGLNAVIAYFYIRGTTEDKVEKKVDKTVQYFLKSHEFHDKLYQLLVKIAENKVAEHDKRIGDLEEKMEFVENTIPIDEEISDVKTKDKH